LSHSASVTRWPVLAPWHGRPHAHAMSPTRPLSSACAGRTTAMRQRWQPSPSSAAPDARCGAVSPSVQPSPPCCVSPHRRAPATDPARAASRASAAAGEPAPRDTLARLESVERVFCSQTLVVASPAAPAGARLQAAGRGRVHLGRRCSLCTERATEDPPLARATRALADEGGACCGAARVSSALGSPRTLPRGSCRPTLC